MYGNYNTYKGRINDDSAIDEGREARQEAGWFQSDGEQLGERLVA